MPDMRCLAIGISDAPPLAFLGGAVNGARMFGRWAEARGILTEILVDAETPVGFEEVRSALLRLLTGNDGVGRLLLYFAGHGLARDAGEDLWLLSRWREEQRAIVVGGLRRRLERFGIGQVTIVADACRTIAPVGDAADLTADAVLGLGPFDPNPARTDLFRPSPRFRSSYMVQGETPDEDRCIFSGVLTEALSGARDDAFDADRGCVTSASLAGFLEKAVPDLAARYGVRLHPDITTGFRSPDDVYVGSRPSVPPPLLSWPTAGVVGALGPRASSRVDGLRGWSTPAVVLGPAAGCEPSRTVDAKPIGGARRRKRRRLIGVRSARPVVDLASTGAAKALDGTIARYVAQYGTGGGGPQDTWCDVDEAEPPTGGARFEIVGDLATAIVVGRAAVASQVSGGQRWQIRAAGEPVGDSLATPVPLLLQTRAGLWGGAAALPGYVGSLMFDDGGAVSLIYRRTNAPGGSAARTELAVARMRADDLNRHEALGLAAELREGKGNDPVRGALAAYLYDRQGDVDGIRRTAYYLAAEGVPLPFDVAMLARARVHRAGTGCLNVEIPAVEEATPRSSAEEARPWTFAATPRMTAVVAGVFPWLRQGWALVDEGELDCLPSDIWRAGQSLLAAPFSTFGDEGGRRLADIVIALL